MVTLRSGARASGADAQVKLEDMASVDRANPQLKQKQRQSPQATQNKAKRGDDDQTDKASAVEPASKRIKTEDDQGESTSTTAAKNKESDADRRRREAEEFDRKLESEKDGDNKQSANDRKPKSEPDSARGAETPKQSDAEQAKTDTKTDEVNSSEKPVKTLKAHDDTDTRAKVPGDVSSLATKSVEINRAPVLELFAASVASVVYPELPWRTCLSCGAWVASVCALAKGRSLGIYTTPSRDGRHGSDVNDAERERRDAEEEVIQVMQFYIPLIEKTVSGGEKVKLAVLHSSSHPNEPKAHGTKSGDESHLVNKFGGEDKLKDAKEAFKMACSTWRSDGDDAEQAIEEFQNAAFGKYEHFRPSVSGWGGRGTLDFAKMYETVARPST